MSKKVTLTGRMIEASTPPKIDWDTAEGAVIFCEDDGKLYDGDTDNQLHVIELDSPTYYRMSDRDMENILTGAFEGGINYWCESARAFTHEELNELSDPFYHVGKEYYSETSAIGCWKRFGVCVIYEHWEDELNEPQRIPHKLTKNKLMNGVTKHIRKQSEQDRLNRVCDFDNWDAGDYDQIIQWSLFNDLRYA